MGPAVNKSYYHKYPICILFEDGVGYIFTNKDVNIKDSKRIFIPFNEIQKVAIKNLGLSRQVTIISSLGKYHLSVNTGNRINRQSTQTWYVTLTERGIPSYKKEKFDVYPVENTYQVRFRYN